jgi:2-hydroxyacyl-CoA lyase 1
MESKKAATVPLLESDEVPMNYYRPLKVLQDALPRDAIIVTEGASTMDISRQVLDNYEPRHRLDAGSWGTMGVGPGFAIAAQVANPGKRVIALEGDAAFGFDGMEVEVAVRHKLPITWIVFNNNGIGGGPSTLPEDAPPPPGAFVPNARYDKVIEAFGGKGYHVETPEQFRAALQESFASGATTLINVAINPQSRRRPQQFTWLTRG